jgi:hypothetical protein
VVVSTKDEGGAHHAGVHGDEDADEGSGRTGLGRRLGVGVAVTGSGPG